MCVLRLFFWLFFSLAAVRMEGNEVSQILNLEEILPHVKKGTLVVFDVDDVLVSPDVSWLWDSEFLKRAMCMTDEEFHSSETQTFLHSLRFPMKYQLVDQNAPQIFSSIERKEGKILALTAREDIELELRNFLYQNTLSFHPSLIHSVYNEGVMCTNGTDKGEYLFSSLLESPQSILFIDDKKENCISLLQACAVRKIPCTVFQYKKADYLSSKVLAQFQYDYWKKKWNPSV